jgi:hypothetical protein
MRKLRCQVTLAKITFRADTVQGLDAVAEGHLAFLTIPVSIIVDRCSSLEPQSQTSNARAPQVLMR